MTGEFYSIADAGAFVREIDQDLADLARDHVETVRKGRMTQREADYVIALLRDIRSDLVHAFDALPIDRNDSVERPDPAVAWRDKVRWIKGELERRRDEYPDAIAKGRILEAAAKRRFAMIRTLHRLYWRELFMWEPEPGPALDWLRALRRCKAGDAGKLDDLIPSGRRLKMELVREHMAVLEREDGKAQGELVAA